MLINVIATIRFYQFKKVCGYDYSDPFKKIQPMNEDFIFNSYIFTYFR